MNPWLAWQKFSVGKIQPNIPVGARRAVLLLAKTAVAFFVLFLSYVPANPYRPIELLRQGDLLYQRGQYSLALDSYRAADDTGMLGTAPGTRIARIELSLGKGPSARKFVDEIERAGAGEGSVLVGRGILAFKHQEYAEAVSHLVGGLRLRPLDGEGRYYLGRSLLLLGENDRAVEEFEGLLSRQGSTLTLWSLEAHYNLGVIGVADGKEEATEHLREAVCSQSSLPPTGESHYVVDQGKELNEVENKAGRLLMSIQGLKGEPSRQPEALAAIGTALLSVGETRPARERFELAAELRPRYAEALAYLGYIEWVEGEYSRAEVLLARSLELQSDAPLTRYFLGVLRRSQDRLAAAVAEFERAIAIDPQSAPAHVELGQTLILERDYAGAASKFERAVELQPDNPGYHLLLARFYLDHGLRFARALEVARRAVRLAPNSPEATDVLGWALWTNGQPYEARQAFEDAVAADPDLASGHYHLAVVLEKSGDVRSAVRELQRALMLEPDGELAGTARAVLETLGHR